MATHRIELESGGVLRQFTDAPLYPRRHNRVVVAQGRPALGWVVDVSDPGEGGSWESTTVHAWAILDGAVEPPDDDAVLGGNLFLWSWGVAPAGAPRPTIAPQYGGLTGFQAFAFDHRHVGTWALTCWRAENGAMVLPIRVSLGVEGAPSI